MTLTWEEVRARSEADKVFCFDCYMCFEAIQMPCLKHCKNDEERAERDQRFAEEMRKAWA